MTEAIFSNFRCSSNPDVAGQPPGSAVMCFELDAPRLFSLESTDTIAVKLNEEDEKQQRWRYKLVDAMRP